MGEHRGVQMTWPAGQLGLLIALTVVGFPTGQAALAQAPAIEIQIRDTATPDDDYITWAPAKARIRQLPAAADRTVVLKNDPQGPVPPGRTHPLDGDVVFDKTVSPGATATKDDLELVLPKDGSWVDFIVAGKFPRSSSSDKDAVIEVHDAASAAVVHRHALMVRVRKDHRKLTEKERARFIEAFDYMHRKAKSPGFQSRFVYFVTMHKIGVWGQEFPMTPAQITHFWPDVGHKAPAFITWHRVFLLQFEREIQAVYPDVTLPYWNMPEPSILFDENFLGTNAIESDPQEVPVKFSPNNLLYGWKIDGASLVRGATARDPGDATFPAFLKDADLFAMTKFSEYPTSNGFAYWVERNPHNRGHGWVGGWMASCLTSPQDPIFWIFHTGFDRQWAHWQHLHGRLKPDGSADSYHRSAVSLAWARAAIRPEQALVLRLATRGAIRCGLGIRNPERAPRRREAGRKIISRRHFSVLSPRPRSRAFGRQVRARRRRWTRSTTPASLQVDSIWVLPTMTPHSDPSRRPRHRHRYPLPAARL